MLRSMQTAFFLFFDREIRIRDAFSFFCFSLILNQQTILISHLSIVFMRFLLSRIVDDYLNVISFFCSFINYYYLVDCSVFNTKMKSLSLFDTLTIYYINNLLKRRKEKKKNLIVGYRLSCNCLQHV